jgi:hypothetical protein
MRWHCAVGEGCEGYVRGGWVSDAGGEAQSVLGHRLGERRQGTDALIS